VCSRLYTSTKNSDANHRKTLSATSLSRCHTVGRRPGHSKGQGLLSRRLIRSSYALLPHNGLDSGMVKPGLFRRLVQARCRSFRCLESWACRARARFPEYRPRRRVIAPPPSWRTNRHSRQTKPRHLLAVALHVIAGKGACEWVKRLWVGRLTTTPEALKKPRNPAWNDRTTGQAKGPWGSRSRRFKSCRPDWLVPAVLSFSWTAGEAMGHLSLVVRYGIAAYGRCRRGLPGPWRPVWLPRTFFRGVLR
jgi:hypothetical protein